MERRLSAILAADMVGYSRLMEADEISTLERQKTHRRELIDPEFEKYHGRVAKEMGDGILGEFRSVVEAVQCAVAIQRAMPEREKEAPEDSRIAYRIGINLGDIVVEEGDIFGDGVNVAARLEQLAEPGGICISGTAYDQMHSTAEIGYEALGEVNVKNIERPIRAYKVLVGRKPVDTTTKFNRSPKRSRMPVMAGVAVFLALIAAGSSWWGLQKGGEPVGAASNIPSIAVLPFDNMSNDPEQEYFVDGITEDLITDLSKISSLFIIARDSVFAYKRQHTDVDQIAHDLGVRYIVDGSVRASDGRVRINSRLVDTQTGGQIWADRFDRKLQDIFDLQDDVTSQIVSALAIQLTAEEKGRLAPSEKETSPEVYDLYLRGVDALRQFTPDSISQARTYFLRSLALDPDYARANAAMAFTYVVNTSFLHEPDTDHAMEQAIRYGKRALDIAPYLPQGHFAMAIALLRQARHEQALESAKNAVKYDPNYADGYVALANVQTFSGEADEALISMRKAMDLNPRYSAAYLDILGRAFFVAGNFEEAKEQFEECISRDPGSTACHVFLAATFALNGEIQDAEWQAEEVLILEPDFTVESNNISYQFKQYDQREMFDKGLRLSGIPMHLN